jgi:CHAT domain-containing protein
LVTDTANITKGFSTASYLVNTTEIQYAYSSNLLFKQPARDALRAPEVLAMAYSNGQEDTDVTSRQGFREIPFSAREIDAIRTRFKRANVYDLKGIEATKEAFLSLAPQYDIIHLAVHGVGDTISSLNSHLIFKSVSDSEDSRLFAYELYNIPSPNWRMVVLSACETGVGKAYKGEGIFSIARGFAYAGAPTEVMSLWKANDQTTEWMMDYFYHHLNRGVTVSKALQLAQIDFLRQVDPQLTRPYFWAGFVVMGDVTPVVSDSLPWYYYVISLLLLIAIYLIIRRVYLVRAAKSTQS